MYVPVLIFPGARVEVLPPASGNDQITGKRGVVKDVSECGGKAVIETDDGEIYAPIHRVCEEVNLC